MMRRLREVRQPDAGRGAGGASFRRALRRAVGVAGWLVLGVALFWVVGQLVGGVKVIPAQRALRGDALRLRDLAGDEVDLAAFDDGVVLVTLWAGWCPPCRAEVPRLNRLAAELSDAGLTVLGVNVEQLEPERLAALRDSLHIEYPVLVPAGPIPSAFHWDGSLPYTVLIDREGRIRASHAGLPSPGSLRRACKRLLQEPRTGDQLPPSAVARPIPAIAASASLSSGP